MTKPKVYLAGPITGLSYGGCTEWRDAVKDALAPDIDAFSPLRAKDYLLSQTTLADQYDQYVLSSQRGIYARDFNDCNTCDLLFVNLLGAEKVSIGTVMEIAWVAMRKMPIILVMENEGNIHEHAMLREACAFRVQTIEEGVFATRAILIP